MAEISQIFLYLLTQTKIYHWQTKNYNKHVSAGKYYEAIEPLIDQFIETYQGRYGQIFYDRFNVSFGNISDSEMMTILDQFKVFLVSDIPKIISPNDTDLFNIRDEILGETNHVIYFLRLN